VDGRASGGCETGAVRILALAGGIGGARFLRGLRAAVPDAELTVVVNTGDDITVYGLRVCPDLDTVMYTLGGGIDDERGWGRQRESWSVREELRAYGSPTAWFGLGDRDLATHLVRRQALDAGYPLSAVTAALCERWQPGARLLPMTDDRFETHVVVDDPQQAGRRKAIHFQEWWVRHRAALPAHAFVGVGADDATPAPGVLEAIAAADVVLLPPSNPVVSIGTVLQVAGVRDALAGKTVVGVSPIVGGAPVRGMADACLRAIGVETSAEAVGRHYGARSGGGLLDGWLVHTSDAGADVPGVQVRAAPLLMTDLDATAAMAREALELAGF
jgi:LPPG:FO 2-phospho-L-lactate transferase